MKTRNVGKMTRLELMLCAWEDLMFIGEIQAKKCKAQGMDKEFRVNYYDGKGGTNNWRTFRKYLLNSVASGADASAFNQDLYGRRNDPFTMIFGKGEGDMVYYLKIAITWTLIAVVFDYLFLVLLFKPADGYYKLDVYFYYTTTFVLPLLVGIFKTRKQKV